MCKRFHAYYKPLSPILQDVLFPVYPGMRFVVFIATVHKRRPFLPAKNDHFLKAGVSHCSHAPGTHQQAPAPATASSTINDCLIAGIFSVSFYNLYFRGPLAELLRPELLCAAVLLAGRAAAARFAALGTSALVLPCALAGCTAGGRLFFSRCTAGCNRLFCPAAGQITPLPDGNSGPARFPGRPCPHRHPPDIRWLR